MTELETIPLHPNMAHEAPLAYAAQQVENAAADVRHHFPVRDHFNPRTHRHIGDPGRPTMRGMLRKERGGGYTKYTILSDIIDEAMLKCMKVGGHLLIDFHASSVDERKLSSIVVYDDIGNGFMGLDIDGEKNPLNLIHYGGVRHTTDEEWSQWGVGLTAASMCCSTNWELTTRFKTCEDTFKYARLQFCWEDMATNDKVIPQHTEISEMEYNSINPFGKGTVFKYTGCFSDIFSGDFQKNVNQLVQMISTKYYKALSFTGDDIPHVKYRLFDSIGDEIVASPIMPDIPPTEQPNHPHEVHEWQIQVRENERGDQKILFKEITPSNNTKWHHEQPDNSKKFKALRTTEYNELIVEYSNNIDVLKMKGTRVSGTEWCRHALPQGSLVIERFGRVMTEDIRADGRYLGFCMQPKNGESNYHYYHLNYKHKPIGNNFSTTYRKIIDGNLMINDTPLNRVLKRCTEKLRAKIGQETAFKKKWKRDHSNLVEWNEELTYQENINAAAAIVTADTADTADAADVAAAAAAADAAPLPPGDALEEAQLGALAAVAAPVDVNVIVNAPSPPPSSATTDEEVGECGCCPLIPFDPAGPMSVLLLVAETAVRENARNPQKISEIVKLMIGQQQLDDRKILKLITQLKHLMCS